MKIAASPAALNDNRASSTVEAPAEGPSAPRWSSCAAPQVSRVACIARGEGKMFRCWAEAEDRQMRKRAMKIGGRRGDRAAAGRITHLGTVQSRAEIAYQTVSVCRCVCVLCVYVRVLCVFYSHAKGLQGSIFHTQTRSALTAVQ